MFCIQYHLATLSLEEIGKSSLIEMQFFANQRIGDENLETGALESHIKKLFWALWGPSFGKARITKQQLEQLQGLATSVHFTRLQSLYIALTDKVHPKKKLSIKEVGNLIGMAEALVGLEKTKTPLSPDDPSIDKTEIDWFLKTSDDPVKRKILFSSKSMDKLVEFGNAKDWIHWLKLESDKENSEIKEIIEAELKREKPQGKTIREPKYRIKVKIISQSHSIRNKYLNEWNQMIDYIKLNSDDKRTLTCEFTLGKGVPLQGLYWIGWGMVRSFVVALNIGSHGFFWWNIQKDISKYYEEVLDIERNMGITVDRSPQLSINWKDEKLVLDKRDLANTSMMFYFITKSQGTNMEQPLNDYCLGLAFTAKDDIHLRLELNAFESFYTAFKKGFQTSGDWDGLSDFKGAVELRLQFLNSTSALRECIELGEEQQKSPTKQTVKPITLTEVFAMKLCCDAYFQVLAKEQIDEERSQMHKEKDENPIK